MLSRVEVTLLPCGEPQSSTRLQALALVRSPPLRSCGHQASTRDAPLPLSCTAACLACPAVSTCSRHSLSEAIPPAWRT